jgi:hypothetical protein
MLIIPRRKVGQTPWTPAQITTSLWLDAADAATVTTVSGAVSQWNDKSGNGRNATQATATSRPAYTTAGLNGLNVITFDGSDDFMDVVTTLFRGIGNFQLHWVFARLGSGSEDSGGAGYRPDISSLSVSGVDSGAFHYIKNTSNVGASYPFFNSSPSWANYDITSGTAYVNNQASLLSFTAGSSAWSVFRDGTQEGAASRGGAVSNDNNGIRIAQQASPPRTSNIYMAELVMTLSDSTVTRQQIEGYLAHKWGLTGSLPAGHPYKTTPPYA